MSTEHIERIIAIGDIHGMFDLLEKMVEQEIGFDPQRDKLVFLGDYIDRGSKSREVVEYVQRLKEGYPDRIVLLKGNHEAMAENYLKSGDAFDFALWVQNGGRECLQSFGGIEEARKILLPFIESLELHYETEKAAFVHGGIPEGKTVQTATEDEKLWTRDPLGYQQGLLIVGHTPHEKVTRYPSVVVVDCGAYMSGKLCALDVLSGQTYEVTDPTRKTPL